MLVQVKKFKVKKPAAKAKRPKAKAAAPKKAREAFVAKWSEAAVKIAEEKKPEVEKGQIWAVMLQRLKAWVVSGAVLGTLLTVGCGAGADHRCRGAMHARISRTMGENSAVSQER